MMPKTNQSGLVQLLLMVLLLAGIGLGVYLVQTKTNLFPWAASNPISGPIFSPTPIPTPAQSILPSPVTSPSSDASLYGYWKMDQSSVYADCTSYSIIDSSGNNRHAKGCPANQSPATALGKFNNGVYFDNYDYAQVKDSEGFNSPNVTVAAWVKLASYSGKYPRIIAKNGAFDLNMYTYTGGEGRLEWDIRIPGETDTKTASHRLELNRWYHIGATYNGSVSRIYINGFKVAERSGLSGNIAATRSPIIFAAITPGDTLRNLNATLDEVRVYTRALTDTEISALASQSN